jgi:hypothetical protein
MVRTGTLVNVIGLDVWIMVILGFLGSSLIHLGPIEAVLEHDWSLMQLFIEGITSGDFVESTGDGIDG